MNHVKESSMRTGIKARIIAALSAVSSLEDYTDSDCIFSQKYAISPSDMIYVLKRLSEDFGFYITDEFVDALELCTFGQLEDILTEISFSLEENSMDS